MKHFFYFFFRFLSNFWNSLCTVTLIPRTEKYIKYKEFKDVTSINLKLFFFIVTNYSYYLPLRAIQRDLITSVTERVPSSRIDVVS